MKFVWLTLWYLLGVKHKSIEEHTKNNFDTYF